MNVNRGKMTAAAVLAVTLLVVGGVTDMVCTGLERWDSHLWRMAD